MLPQYANMKLGVGYNVFDGEELLESSIRSIRSEAHWVAVVYQEVSNFGARCSKDLMFVLQTLKDKGLIDELRCYVPVEYSDKERADLVSMYAGAADLGGPIASVAPQYLCEVAKRSLALDMCRAAGCDYFLSMDTDEYYDHQLHEAKEFLQENPKYDVSACLMRYYFKSPTYELLPLDTASYVPFIFRIKPQSAFALAHPFPVRADPTRVPSNATRLHIFPPDVLVMHHMSFVRSRQGLLSKLHNVSNKRNYTAAPEEALEAIARWSPDDAVPIPHPHPYFAKHYTSARVVENRFNVPLPEL